MKKNNSLLTPIVFLVIGVILFTDPDSMVKFISYILGGLLIIVGVYRCANYYIQDKRMGVVNNNELAFGITAFILGLLFIVLASAIEFLIRVFFGVYLILIGISKVYQTFFTTDRSSKFYALIVVGLIFLAGGVYTIIESNITLSIIGLFMIIYGVVDFISYFVYKDNGKSNPVKEAEIVKEITSEDEIEETKKVNKKDKKSKKSKKGE